jgi:hypothetical protein
MPLAGERVRASDTPGRVGCTLRRAANQSIPNAAATAISWDTEDEDTHGFAAVTTSTVTIPAGLGGIYVVTAHVICPGIATTSGPAVIIDPTTSLTGVPADYLMPLDGTRDRGTITAVIPLEAGDTFNVQVFHATGAAVNFTASLHCYRMAI